MKVKLKKAFYDRLTTKYIVYNACNEDPRVDLELMSIGSDSSVCMLCSAGCNALHYLLADPLRIDCIDFNPCQIALADLKFKSLQSLPYQDLWNMFAEGTHPDIKTFYQEQLRDGLLPKSKLFWDKNITKFFSRRAVKKGLYYRSVSGSLSIVSQFIGKEDKNAVSKLFETDNLNQQSRIFDRHLLPYLNGKFVRLSVEAMFKTGIPSRQLNMLCEDAQRAHSFLIDRTQHVLTKLPAYDNYFYYQYLFGKYQKNCCPEYLRERNIPVLRERIDRIHLHNTEFAKFLEQSDRTYSHFFLLDHLDWLVDDPQKLSRQWRAILNKSTVGTEILIRSFLPGLDWLPKQFRGHVSFAENINHAVVKDRVGHYQQTYLLTVTQDV